ncbi:glycoside hydrolase family 3 N-terminal domain-containing protein [Aquipuribacter hungaricus]|uniref:glycoside hydrolase family 3 N-terminal domain-containing protein n=1 Tax=Aquipuribacter hungaricus TaxID=545624 RepID=UPI00361E96E6
MAVVPAAIVLAATLLLGGCGAVGSAGPAGDAASVAPARPSPAAAPSPPPCEPAPLEQLAAAVLVVGLPGVTGPDDPLAVQVTGLGVGGVFLSGDNVVDAPQVTALSAGLRARSARPLLVSTDEESGRVAATREVVGSGPSPRRLASTSTPEEVRAFAAGIGASLAGVGVDLDLAPVLDLDDGDAGATIGDRSFSADPATASAFGLAFAAGLQDAEVTPTVKHFPGHGRAGDDTHTGDAVVDAPLAELEAVDLVPFQDAVDAGAPVVMTGHVQYTALEPGVPASLSPATYALLRRTGFQGVAMTDSIGMGAVNLRHDFPEAAVLAVLAGADAVLATDGSQAPRMRDALVEAVVSGRLPEDRLSEAAARVTALAGGDPVTLSCLDVTLPTLVLPGPTAPAPPSPSVPSPSASAKAPVAP